MMRVSQYHNVSILDFIGADDEGGGGDNWSYKMCKAPVKSSLATYQHPTFLWARCPSCHPTNSATALTFNHNNMKTQKTAQSENFKRLRQTQVEWEKLSQDHNDGVKYIMNIANRNSRRIKQTAYSYHWCSFLAEFNQCWSHVDDIKFLMISFTPIDEHVRTPYHLRNTETKLQEFFLQNCIYIITITFVAVLN